jgi:phospholipid-translocating ATPase
VCTARVRPPNLGASQSGRISLSRQAVFSALFYFAPIPLYNGVLVVGYATLFTTGPVFSLVLDEDVSESNALKFPQLYRELQVEARG